MTDWDEIAAECDPDTTLQTLRYILGVEGDALPISMTSRWALIKSTFEVLDLCLSHGAVPAEWCLHEVACPVCGATIRARMAD